MKKMIAILMAMCLLGFVLIAVVVSAYYVAAPLVLLGVSILVIPLITFAAEVQPVKMVRIRGSPGGRASGIGLNDQLESQKNGVKELSYSIPLSDSTT